MREARTCRVNVVSALLDARFQEGLSVQEERPRRRDAHSGLASDGIEAARVGQNAKRPLESRVDGVELLSQGGELGKAAATDRPPQIGRPGGKILGSQSPRVARCAICSAGYGVCWEGVLRCIWVHDSPTYTGRLKTVEQQTFVIN